MTHVTPIVCPSNAEYGAKQAKEGKAEKEKRLREKKEREQEKARRERAQAEEKRKEEEEAVRSLDDLDAGDMSMMTIDEELEVPQARLESGKTYYQILWTEQGGTELQELLRQELARARADLAAERQLREEAERRLRTTERAVSRGRHQVIHEMSAL